MLLLPQEADLFSKLHRAFMCFVNKRLQIVPNINTPEQMSSSSLEVRLNIRNAFLKEANLIDLFLEANPFDFSKEELGIVDSWRHQVVGKFYIFRYLRNYTVFLTTEEPLVAYGVVALNDPIEELIGPVLPIVTETVLLPFKGKIVYDGLLLSYSISIGPGIRRGLNERYMAAKERLGIVTALPISSAPMPAKKPPKKNKPKKPRASTGEVQEVLGIIVGMIDDFCRQHLTEEYAVLCHNLAEKLARKRPSPLLSGRPNTWACGIVRTIGWINFLDDRSKKPHMKLTAIDKAFGVGESTGQGKSTQIRRLLRIQQFDHHWILPSRMDASPLVWMLEVNGMLRDIRTCPREAQEVAFEKGLIPYLPADED